MLLSTGNGSVMVESLLESMMNQKCHACQEVHPVVAVFFDPKGATLCWRCANLALVLVCMSRLSDEDMSKVVKRIEGANFVSR